MNKNRCEACTTSSVDFNFLVADTGQCGQCLYVNECIDVELLELYRSYSLSDEIIYKYLPRLRCSHIGTEPPIDDLALRKELKVVAELAAKIHKPEQFNSPLLTVANEVLVNYFRQDEEVTNFISHIIDDHDTNESYQITMQKLGGVSLVESFSESTKRVEDLESALASIYLLIERSNFINSGEVKGLIQGVLLGESRHEA
ncbi:hypothetical protein [uncultured Pseudoalteromonas sp.]|uniref:hypothetical protein n=1 Tax=uncultured Pseudoalteromonas sp. TaxID=114053 RepID=UPI00259A925B|nr:hypothetical protein [uncultured Pseudoalteromonas sp.]